MAGGWQRDTNLATSEVLAPAAAAWGPGPPLRVARDGHCAVALADGSVLLFGGQDPSHRSVREVEVVTAR
ncbi:MAG TPA: kelch repeat-containing protein [Polyangia bacterium]